MQELSCRRSDRLKNRAWTGEDPHPESPLSIDVLVAADNDDALRKAPKDLLN
jgi:hypothetical protein